MTADTLHYLQQTANQYAEVMRAASLQASIVRSALVEPAARTHSPLLIAEAQTALKAIHAVYKSAQAKWRAAESRAEAARLELMAEGQEVQV